VLAATVLAATGTPARAEEQQRSGGSKAGTVIKWTLIGAAAGAAAGFGLGFRWYDDAVYSERKIWSSTVLGGGVGGAIGFGIGRWRAHRPAPAPATAPSLWRPDEPIKFKALTARSAGDFYRSSEDQKAKSIKNGLLPDRLLESSRVMTGAEVSKNN
jgi:hypothetical protein